jgi:hypothetical protein
MRMNHMHSRMRMIGRFASIYRITAVIAVFLIQLLAISQTLAAAATDKADKSGTNPINFTNDMRLYHEYQNLNVDGEAHITTLEGRTPVMDGKVQVRVRIPFKSVNSNVGPLSIDESGLGDINARLLTVPYLKKGFAIAVGLEAFFPTASDDALGEGKLSLGPQIFAVKFAPLGIRGSLVAPAVQQIFSVAGEGDRSDVSRTQFDIFFLKQSSDKRWWVLLDPQYVIDWENDTEFGLIEAEAGHVFESGVSLYLRPGVGFGGDKPVDYNIEFGIKYIF